MTPRLLPDDKHNAQLISNVHPPEWRNPEPQGRYNLVVIGAGTAGLVAAAGAAGLGARVALVEKNLLGGDCLNVGCVPSKAVIRSARAASDVRDASLFGIDPNGEPQVRFASVMERMRRLRAGISSHDSAWRFRDLGVDVFLGEGRFCGCDAVEVEGKILRFSKALIATGARPATPRIEGLAEAGCLTNETVFSLTERPNRLGVIGGGPLGCELAQAFNALGCEVSIIHKNAHILDKEDEDAADIVQRKFLRDGIRLILSGELLRIERTPSGKRIFFRDPKGEDSLEVDEILVGAGRLPNVERLNLEAAGVAYDKKTGVAVDDFLRTSNRRIYAAGDIALSYKFTHTADATARIVLRNALFRGRRRLSALTVPWCTYTTPEIAHVGMYERDARGRGIPMETFVRRFDEMDRAVIDGDDEGFVKVHVMKGSDRILGATIVARHAGEMISEITLAMTGGLGLKTIAETIHPYPTQSEAIKQVADMYNRSRLTPFVRRLFDLWLAWTR